MMRLRATKFQRYAVKPGGSSETTQPRSTMRVVEAPARRRVRHVGAAREHRDDRAADVLQRADVRGRVHAHAPARRRPARRRPRGRARASARPRGRSRVPRRAPTIATAVSARERLRAARRRAAPPAGRRARAAARDSRRRSGRSRVSPARRDRGARRARVERGVPRTARGAVERDERVVGQRQHAGGRRPAPPLHVEPRRRRRRSARSGAGSRRTRSRPPACGVRRVRDALRAGATGAAPCRRPVMPRACRRGVMPRACRRGSCRERERLVVESQRRGAEDVRRRRRRRRRRGPRPCARRAGCGRGRARRGGCGRAARTAAAARPAWRRSARAAGAR